MKKLFGAILCMFKSHDLYLTKWNSKGICKEKIRCKRCCYEIPKIK
jgi:hypothetical protein